ncbi:MAG: hypothetical protein IKJ11_01275 [Clostridia bacterium]|nr:hypothetical protein [Clostridia bacterium]
MQEIIFKQRNAAKALTGRAFVLSIAGILIRLSIAQIVINQLISATGVGLLNIAFYLYAVLLLIRFMHDTVAGYVYTLKEDTLVLERKLGDSTITVVEVPLKNVASLRQVRMAENLHISYRDVMHIDASTRPPMRVRTAFAVSLISSRLARRIAGKKAQDAIGYVIVFDEGSLRRACTFCPNEEMLARLEAAVGERHGFDERMTHAKVRTLYGRALERAFPQLYPFVDPLVKPEDVEWARAEIDRQRAERKGKKDGKRPQADTQDGEKADGGQDDAPRRRRKRG